MKGGLYLVYTFLLRTGNKHFHYCNAAQIFKLDQYFISIYLVCCVFLNNGNKLNTKKKIKRKISVQNNIKIEHGFI